MYLRKKYGSICTKRSANYLVIMKIFKRILFVLAIVMMATTASAQKSDYVNHIVAKGETLFSISKRYNTTVDEVIRLNPGSEVKLSIGQELIIPRNTTNKKKSGKTHVIQPGETLYRLSKMYDVTTDDICNANPGLSKNNFKAGEEIVIPTKQDIQRLKEEEKEKKKQKKGKLEEPKTAAVAKPEVKAEQKKEEQKQLQKEPQKEQQKQLQKEEEQTIICTHKVKRREDIEDICEKYGITPEELIKANPILREKKLKRKMVLNIPAPTKSNADEDVDKEAKKEEEVKEVITVTPEPEIEEVKILPGGFNDDNVVNVAVILSFLIDSYVPKEQERLIEYYQGFLMAVEQLKREGHSFVINTFDAGQKDESLDSLLASGALDDVELIIGASYSKHNKELAKYAKEREIPLIVPLATKKDEAINNPMVYIVNAVQQYVLPQISEGFVKQFPDANVLFLEDETNNKKEFVKSLKTELDKNEIPHTTLPLEMIITPDSVLTTLSLVQMEERDLIIIPTSSSPATLNALLPSLLEAKSIDSIGVSNFKLFGYPEWQIHAKDTRELMYEVDTYIYATFYSHYSLPRVAQFQEEYIRWYNRGIQNIYPRYSMMGYDTGYFFLLAASMYGNSMHERINETPFSPVQSDFRMERISEKDGFVNNKFLFIHFTPEYYIDKIDLDKIVEEEQIQDEGLYGNTQTDLVISEEAIY